MTFVVGDKVKWNDELGWGWVADPKAWHTSSLFHPDGLPDQPDAVWVWPNPRLEKIRLDNILDIGSGGGISEIGGWHSPESLTLVTGS